jgi:hypothetical protein
MVNWKEFVAENKREVQQVKTFSAQPTRIAKSFEHGKNANTNFVQAIEQARENQAQLMGARK